MPRPCLLVSPLAVVSVGLGASCRCQFVQFAYRPLSLFSQGALFRRGVRAAPTVRHPSRVRLRRMHLKLPTPVFVPYDAPLLPGRLVDRRDRFIAEVSLDDAPDEETVLAHCINPGRKRSSRSVRGSGCCLRRVPSASSGSRGRRSRRWA